jgi:hypothetical protein
MTESIKLNNHSQQVLNYLQENRPELAENISFISSDHFSDAFGDYFFEIKIASPNKNIESYFFFNTDDNNLTVGFDHCYPETGINEQMKYALDTWDKIISEKLVVTMFLKTKEDKWCASCLSEVNSDNTIVLNHHAKQYPKIKIVSWLGTYDTEDFALLH